MLVTAEFLPTGLLTPMAADLGITTGQAAQTVTLTAIVGFLVAPTVAILIPRMDRRTLLAWVTLVAVISNLVVALVPSFWLILASRALLGAAISGFWAMSLAVATRLAPPEHLGRAVMVITVGPSLAIVAGVPVGVIIAEQFGWRATFAVAAGLTLLVSILIATLVPSIPASASVGLRPLVTTLTQRGIPLGLAGHVLTIIGHITAFTFIRVAVERIPGVDVGTITIVLALFGVGGLVGNLVIGLLVDRHLGTLAILVPGLMTVAVATVALSPGSVAAVSVAVFVWGASFGAWLIIVNAWASRVAPDRPEPAGALVVTGFQFAIAVGAAVGGLLVDATGVGTTLLLASGALLVGTVLFGTAGSRAARTR